MSTTPALRGVFVPLTTPFTSDGAPALDRMAENIARYNRLPLAGYVVTGSTGEAVMLTRAETERVWSSVRESAGPEKLLIAGASSDSTAETISRIRRAAELGYPLALVKTPYYYKALMTPAVLEEHYRRVADASPIPILIYSVPVFTGITVEADLAARLASHPNIAGIKDSSGSPERAGQIVAQAHSGFQVAVGSAQFFAASLAVGARAGILAAACVLPELCLDVYAAFREGRRLQTDALQQALSDPARTIVSKYGPPGVKYAMGKRGYFGGSPRLPLQPLSPTAASEVDASLAKVTELAPSR
jgi:4-hydroxy-2-oxoglutarate aldolase